MYYKMNAAADPRLRELAISFWKSTTQYEMPLLEKLAAYTYLLTGSEQAWIGRLYSSFFWVLGGIGLIALSRRMFSGIASDRAPGHCHPGLPGISTCSRRSRSNRAAIFNPIQAW